jgi:Na+/H+ antiporter NhaD/arsenite permease-like protein
MLHKILRQAADRLRAEPFFLITVGATIFVSFFARPRFESIGWSVIAVLFSQMLVCAAFDECLLLQSLAGWSVGIFRTPKRLGLAMVLLSGLLAMFITNDIALLTVVPVTISISKITGRGPHLLVVLETAAANLFSAVTPFGNPQNLYLYTYFNIPAPEFFGMMLPFGLAGAVLLIGSVPILCRGGCYDTAKHRFETRKPRLLAGALVVFIVNILAVLRVLDWRIALGAAVIGFLLLAPSLFKKVDYILLLTFVLFFLFTDGFTAIPAVKSFFGGLLGSETSVLLTSAALSQVISNVPAAVVLSGFTPHYKALLYGVSAGGLGTLIASLASLISYKLYTKAFPTEKGPYLRVFYGVNAVFLALLLLTLTVLLCF